MAMGKPVIAPNVGFCWDYPVIRYAGKKHLLDLLQRLVIPKDGWGKSAAQLVRLCERLVM